MQFRGEKSSSSSNSSYSPSFNSYFNRSLTQIAARVCHEVIDEESEFVEPVTVPVEFSSFRFSEDDCKRNDFTAVDGGSDSFDADNEAEDENEDEDDDNDSFEFEFNVSSSLLSLEGENVVGPIYPVFDRSLLKDLESNNNYSKRNNDEAVAEKSDVLIPLKSLFLRDWTFEPEQPSSSSSSEADEFEAIPAGTYCVWAPQSPNYRCTKSNSTGSTTASSSTVAAAILPSKTWRLRNLLRRSKSDGKEGLVLLGPPQPSTNNKKKEEEKNKKKNKVNYEKSVKGKQQQQVVKKTTTMTTTAARGGYYGKKNGSSSQNREGGGGGEFNKRKSYLPYRQDLVGLFASPHGHGMRKMGLPSF